MTRAVIVRPPARIDLLESYAFIGLGSAGNADRFLEAAEHTFRQLADWPTMGRRWRTPIRRLSNVRVWRVRGFPKWLVFYLSSDEAIEVLRVLHGARDLHAILNDEPF
jgi:toxin ParE1/3/4